MSAVRLVIAIEDAWVHPAAGIGTCMCTRCGRPCYLDYKQEMPLPLAFQVMVCARCALADPEMAGEVVEIHRQAREMYLRGEL